ncbi:phytanoyl-CoA hydroxylase-interacting protein-like [Branchiostoma floridae x Branchiostoma japonicum]
MSAGAGASGGRKIPPQVPPKSRDRPVSVADATEELSAVQLQGDAQGLSTPCDVKLSHITCDSFKIQWSMDPKDHVTHFFIDLNKKANVNNAKKAFKHKDVPTKLVAKAIPLPFTVKGHWFLQPRTNYTVSVQTACKLPDGEYKVSDWSETVEFCTADYSSVQLNQLLDKARNIMSDRKLPLTHFYRNQHQDYFDFMRMNHGGVLQPSIKDDGGSHGSPINGNLKGISFSANVEWNERDGPRIPIDSPYGRERFLCPAAAMFNENANLYFADLYCMYTAYHFVNLVLTTKGSEGDQFCSGKLPLLDPSNNEFLTRKKRDDGSMEFAVCQDLIVELFYTEPMKMKEGQMVSIEGHVVPSLSTENAKKDASCKMCNINK